MFIFLSDIREKRYFLIGTHKGLEIERFTPCIGSHNTCYVSISISSEEMETQIPIESVLLGMQQKATAVSWRAKPFVK